jgi:hypothetical protein
MLDLSSPATHTVYKTAAYRIRRRFDVVKRWG